jgi:hypothetical protein
VAVHESARLNIGANTIRENSRNGVLPTREPKNGENTLGREYMKNPRSSGRTITGLFDMTVTPQCLNPRAAWTILPSCFAIRGNSMSGNCSAAP